MLFLFVKYDCYFCGHVHVYQQINTVLIFLEYCFSKWNLIGRALGIGGKLFGGL